MNIRVTKKLPIILAVVILLLIAGIFAGKMIVNAKAASDTAVSTQTVKEESTGVSDEEALVLTAAAMDDTGTKAIAAGLAVGLAAAAGAVAMGIAIAKSAEGISRQPEAEGSIRTSLMLGLVFIETAIIYALIVAILIIFVM
ncbi:MAG: ATP synthase F0 subunit C [Eubacterium sp.]|nr:ATP synthase F0 subunit C [Eubacterium sp.]